MDREKPLEARFFRTETNNEPAREWLKSLPKEEKRLIGEDIKTVQYGWPIGMPVVEKLYNGVWEVKTNLKDKISRVLFTMYEGKMIILHGFIKKTRKTPIDDLNLAIKRMKELKRG